MYNEPAKALTAITIPRVEVSVNIEAAADRCTIVHCRYADAFPALLRIWPATYLLQENGVKKMLVQAFNISHYPQWTLTNGCHTFTLLFEGLDADCNAFDLTEDIPEEGGFCITGIRRNKSDVYNVDVN